MSRFEIDPDVPRAVARAARLIGGVVALAALFVAAELLAWWL